MGTSFTNIHIKGADIQMIEPALREALTAEKSYSSKSMDFMKDLELPEAVLNEILGAWTPHFLVGRVNPNWITVLNSSFGFETIEETALNYSKRINGLFLVVDYFKDDVFSMYFIKEGKTLTSHISGPGLDYYDLSEELGNTELMCKELDLSIASDELKDILQMDDIMDKVQRLEQVFQLPLWIKADWLDDMEAEVKDKFIKVE